MTAPTCLGSASSQSISRAEGKGLQPVSPQDSPYGSGQAHVTPSSLLVRPSVLPPATSSLLAPFPSPLPGASVVATSGPARRSGASIQTRKDRGRPRPAEQHRTSPFCGLGAGPRVQAGCLREAQGSARTGSPGRGPGQRTTSSPPPRAREPPLRVLRPPEPGRGGARAEPLRSVGGALRDGGGAKGRSSRAGRSGTGVVGRDGRQSLDQPAVGSTLWLVT